MEVPITPTAYCSGGYVDNLGPLFAFENGADFWKAMATRDFNAERKLKRLGISPRFLRARRYSGLPSDIMKAYNKRKKRARARTGRR